MPGESQETSPQQAYASLRNSIGQFAKVEQSPEGHIRIACSDPDRDQALINLFRKLHLNPYTIRRTKTNERFIEIPPYTSWAYSMLFENLCSKNLQQERIDIKNQLQEIWAKIKVLKTSVRQDAKANKKKQKELRQDIARFQVELEELQKEYDEQYKLDDEADDNLDEIKEEIEDVKEQIQEAEKFIEKLDIRLDNLTNELQSFEHEKDILLAKGAEIEQQAAAIASAIITDKSKLVEYFTQNLNDKLEHETNLLYMSNLFNPSADEALIRLAEEPPGLKVQFSTLKSMLEDPRGLANHLQWIGPLSNQGDEILAALHNDVCKALHLAQIEYSLDKKNSICISHQAFEDLLNNPSKQHSITNYMQSVFKQLKSIKDSIDEDPLAELNNFLNDLEQQLQAVHPVHPKANFIDKQIQETRHSVNELRNAVNKHLKGTKDLRDSTRKEIKSAFKSVYKKIKSIASAGADEVKHKLLSSAKQDIDKVYKLIHDSSPRPSSRK